MDDSGGIDDGTAFAFWLMTWMSARGLGGDIRRELGVYENVSQVCVALVGD